MAKGRTKDPTERFVSSKSKWVRVIAGPGAGKSYALRERLKYLVNREKVSPERILVLTFTSVAAQDLRQEIRALGLGRIEVSTLHALARRILEQKKGGARLLLDFETDTMLRDLEPELGKYRGKKELLRRAVGGSGTEALSDEERQLSASLKKWMNQHHGIVLEDLIPSVCRYLSGNQAARKRHCYDRILVDEYQDLNPAEQRMVELLLAKRGKLSVIGDDDQAIYAFQGAYPEGIRDFTKTHPGCEDLRFTECYRCPKDVVKLANRLIANNRDRLEKTFTPHRKNQPGSCELLRSETPEEELDKLCDMLQTEIKQLDVKQIVMLTPTKERGRRLYEAMKEKGIPAAFCYRDAVFDSKAAQKSFSLLSLAADPNDLVSWRYLLGGEGADRGALSYRHIRACADREKRGVLSVLEDCAAGTLKVPYTSALIKRYKAVKSQLDAIQAEPTTILTMVGTDAAEYAELLGRAFSAEWSSGGFEGVRRAVLDEVFSPAASASTDRVRIMSLHAAKGLSARLVVVMSAVEGLIPLKGKDSLEEQRRLFYVAITRCKGGKAGSYPGKLLISSFASSEDGETAYQTTRFVEEMGLS